MLSTHYHIWSKMCHFLCYYCRAKGSSRLDRPCYNDMPNALQWSHTQILVGVGFNGTKGINGREEEGEEEGAPALLKANRLPWLHCSIP